MSELKGTLPRGTEVTINGFQVRFNENLHFTALGVSNYDEAAERSALGGFPADWTHYETTEDGRTLVVQYGPQGNRVETEVVLDEGASAIEDVTIEAQIPEDAEVVEEVETHPVTIHANEDAPVEEVVEEVEVVEEAPKPKAKGKKAK